MASIDRILLVHLYKHSLVIIDLLKEADCCFLGIDFLTVTRFPTKATFHFIPIPSSTILQFLP